LAVAYRKLAEPLGELFDCVVKEAKVSIEWYKIRRTPKQIGGQILRVSAIVFAAIAANLSAKARRRIWNSCFAWMAKDDPALVAAPTEVLGLG
jgi:hypothetical protein